MLQGLAAHSASLGSTQVVVIQLSVISSMRSLCRSGCTLIDSSVLKSACSCCAYEGSPRIFYSRDRFNHLDLRLITTMFPASSTSAACGIHTIIFCLRCLVFVLVGGMTCLVYLCMSSGFRCPRLERALVRDRPVSNAVIVGCRLGFGDEIATQSTLVQSRKT